MKNQLNNDKFVLRNSDLKQTVNADLNFLNDAKRDFDSCGNFLP